jgi:tripartite-type tricarboxylate transporter receptor subunit TctC
MLKAEGISSWRKYRRVLRPQSTAILKRPSRRRILRLALAPMLAGMLNAVIGLPGMAEIVGHSSPPVTIIVPYPAGSTADILPRLVAQMLTDKGGRTYIIDNKPGATQAIGIRAAAQAKPDGNTILFGSAAGLVIAPAMKTSLPYDVTRDFEPITLTHLSPLYLITRKDLPVKSVADLLELARRTPNKLTYGTGGPGSIAHLAGELMKAQANVSIIQIPYAGAGPALRDVAGGHIDMTFTGSLLGLADQLNVLATTGGKRSQSLPKIPTMKEAGLPDFEIASWFGFLAPSGTPASTIDTFATEIAAVIASPEFRDRLQAAGSEFELETSTPDEFRAFIARQIPMWRKVVKAANIPTSD